MRCPHCRLWATRTARYLRMHCRFFCRRTPRRKRRLTPVSIDSLPLRISRHWPKTGRCQTQMTHPAMMLETHSMMKPRANSKVAGIEHKKVKVAAVAAAHAANQRPRWMRPSMSLWNQAPPWVSCCYKDLEASRWWHWLKRDAPQKSIKLSSSPRKASTPAKSWKRWVSKTCRKRSRSYKKRAASQDWALLLA